MVRLTHSIFIKKLILSILSFQQLAVLLENASSDPELTMFTRQLASVASNLTYSGDLPVLIDVLIQSLSISSASDLSNESFMVSILKHSIISCTNLIPRVYCCCMHVTTPSQPK